MYHKRWKNELQNQVLKDYNLTQKTPSAQLQKHITKTHYKNTLQTLLEELNPIVKRGFAHVQ